MDRRAVVTGANSGIGAATAHRLASDGHEVFAGARSPEGHSTIEQAAARLATEGPARPGRITPVQLDVTDDDSVAEAFSRILAGGPIDVLVNNAGITGAGSIEETPLEIYRQMFETNVAGVVRCTQQVLPGMRERGVGRIVNMSSSSAVLSPPLMGPYASTKRAVESLSESLQAEVAPFGIRVTVIQAGTIMTPIWGRSEPPPDDTAYPASRDFLMTVLAHQLTNTGVPPEIVAAAIAGAVESDDPPFRQLVGDAEVLAAMRSRHDDEALMSVYDLDGQDFRDRYRELSGTDYWP